MRCVWCSLFGCFVKLCFCCLCNVILDNVWASFVVLVLNVLLKSLISFVQEDNGLTMVF